MSIAWRQILFLESSVCRSLQSGNGTNERERRWEGRLGTHPGKQEACSLHKVRRRTHGCRVLVSSVRHGMRISAQKQGEASLTTREEVFFWRRLRRRGRVGWAHRAVGRYCFPVGAAVHPPRFCRFLRQHHQLTDRRKTESSPYRLDSILCYRYALSWYLTCLPPGRYSDSRYKDSMLRS
ncbi:hypothetical protein EDC04DRAFT_2702785 [Pisolithus marmoratus]|nr:hypothetical protein EDC04DRAFT_2702785 [Pisolithus marmoratus]